MLLPILCIFLLSSAPVVGRRHITVTTGEELQSAIGSNVTIYFGADIMLDENALDDGIQIYGTNVAPITGLVIDGQGHTFDCNGASSIRRCMTICPESEDCSSTTVYIQDLIMTGGIRDDGGCVGIWPSSGDLDVTFFRVSFISCQTSTSVSSHTNGGALYVAGGAIKVISSIFESNIALLAGGAIDLYHCDSLLISATQFNNNHAPTGPDIGATGLCNLQCVAGCNDAGEFMVPDAGCSNPVGINRGDNDDRKIACYPYCESADSDCSVCPANQYYEEPSDNKECTSCPSGRVIIDDGMNATAHSSESDCVPEGPSLKPSPSPTQLPSHTPLPTSSSEPTAVPSNTPTSNPTSYPSISSLPTSSPTIICPPGEEVKKEDNTCDPCEAGKSNPIGSGQRCEKCPPGYYVQTSGSSNCTKCPIGLYSDEDRLLCSNCKWAPS